MCLYQAIKAVLQCQWLASASCNQINKVACTRERKHGPTRLYLAKQSIGNSKNCNQINRVACTRERKYGPTRLYLAKQPIGNSKNCNLINRVACTRERKYGPTRLYLAKQPSGNTKSRIFATRSSLAKIASKAPNLHPSNRQSKVCLWNPHYNITNIVVGITFVNL